ncbi:MAG: DUF4249 domain-containing protein [Cyclobacteriaceae bacterium]
MKPYYSIISVIILSGCLKTYEPDLNRFERVIVIDGTISDGSGPHEVKISYTYPLDSAYQELVRDAKVWVTEDQSKVTEFEEKDPGVYNAPDGFKGQVGSSYVLSVQLNNGTGELFQSQEEYLAPSPPIDSIYAVYKRTTSSTTGDFTGGLQFFIDVGNQKSGSQYFRYEWEETYRIEVPYPASHQVIETKEDTVITPLVRSYGICYDGQSSNTLQIASSLGVEGNQIIEYPIRFVSEEAQELSSRYALLVKQYAISERAYTYYFRLQENNNSGGSLFDQQTGAIYGNISAVNNNNQAVLGYFEVSGVSQKRRFFDRTEMPSNLERPVFPYICLESGLINTTEDSALHYTRNNQWNIVGYEDLIETITIHSVECSDCSFYANVIPPEFWED